MRGVNGGCTVTLCPLEAKWADVECVARRVASREHIHMPTSLSGTHSVFSIKEKKRQNEC